MGKNQKLIPVLSNKNNKMSYLFMVTFDLPQPLQRGIRAYNIHNQNIKSPLWGDLEGSRLLKSKI